MCQCVIKLSIRCTCICIKDDGNQKQVAMMFLYYYLFKEMVYNAGETDTQTRTYDPPITPRCRFLNCSRWKLNNNSMAHEGDGRSSDSNENAISSETKINISNGTLNSKDCLSVNFNMWLLYIMSISSKVDIVVF